jgi:hypothetical protein
MIRLSSCIQKYFTIFEKTNLSKEYV